MASTPVTERTGIQELRYRVQLCRDFHTVLAKVGFNTMTMNISTQKYDKGTAMTMNIYAFQIDPGWSELSMFALRELHFTRLSLLQVLFLHCSTFSRLEFRDPKVRAESLSSFKI